MASQFELSDEALRCMVDSTARVCLDPRFEALFKELETLYTQSRVSEPRLDAFRDAYYAVVQENGAVQSAVEVRPAPRDQAAGHPVPTTE